MKILIRKISISFVAFITACYYVPVVIADDLKYTNSVNIDIRKDDHLNSDDEEDLDARKANGNDNDTNTRSEDLENTPDIENTSLQEPTNEEEITGTTELIEVNNEKNHMILQDNFDEDSNVIEQIASEEEVITELILQLDVRDEAVITLKVNLSTLGFHVSNNPTTLFGPLTEQKVREFQEYYGLPVTGIADISTLELIEKILDSPFQDGRKHDDTITLKVHLEKLGFHISNNPTNLYGPLTANAVREFQKRHGLIINGIADPITLAKIDQQLNATLSNGVFRNDVIDLKINLEKIGFFISSNPTIHFGPITELTVRQFQEYYGLEGTGIADSETIALIDKILNSPFHDGRRHEDTITLKLNLLTLGLHISDNPTTLFGPLTSSAVREFQQRHGLIVNGIADPITLAKIDEQINSPLTGGLYRNDVIDLKVNLAKIGFGVSSNPTVFFGPITTRTVREFQEYYGLDITGVADEKTLEKIDEILSSPFQNRNRHEDVIQLKIDLAKVGFHISNIPTDLYASQTEKAVREFQALYGLRVNGIADSITLAKIAYLIENPDSIISKEIVTYTYYNLTLEEALNRQFLLNPPPQTDRYRNVPAFIHSSLIDLIERGMTNMDGVRIRTSPHSLSNDTIHATVSNGTVVEVVREVSGVLANGSNRWYEVIYNGNSNLFIHAPLVDITKVAVIQSNAHVRETANTNSHSFGTASKDQQFAVVGPVEGTTVNDSSLWYEVRYSVWRNAKSEDVLTFIDPNQVDMYQHLRLDASAGVSATQLNTVLNGRGILNNLGQAFVDAGRTHTVNEIYLIAHALLETGNGTSGLATGTEVGRDSSGNLVLANPTNRASLTNIRTTYNMFGINAHDHDPYRLGAIHAYNQGWFTPEAAIIGGAAFISNSYLQRGQNTLYKMRWNHLYSNHWGGFPQYATDMEWAVKQVPRIKNLYSQLNGASRHFDIVQYR